MLSGSGDVVKLDLRWCAGFLLLPVAFTGTALAIDAVGSPSGVAVSQPISAQPAPAVPTQPAPPVGPPVGAQVALAGALAVAGSGTSIRPVELRIPALGVTSAVMQLGLTTQGTLQVPPAGFPAGWYTGSPAPGSRGPAVLAGHVDWDGAPGVFYDLHRLVPGDQVLVARSDSSTAVFSVSRVERVAKKAFPTAEVYGDLDHPGLRLVTCGGPFDHDAESYTDNVIVFADLLRVLPRPG